MKRIKTGGQHVKESPPESVFEEGPNPLLNYAILSELMSYLPVPDLRHCRLVNSAWRTAATPHLKKNSWLRSHKTFPGSGGLFMHLRSSTSSTYLDDLCFSKQGDQTADGGLIELGLFGIQNFHLNLPPFLVNSSAKEILMRFLEEYGPTFRNILLQISTETLELLGTVLTSMPNLLNLSINFERDFSHATVWHVWPSSTLPRGMPSIKRISIVNNIIIYHIRNLIYYVSPQVRDSIVATNHYNFLKRLLQVAPNLEALELKDSLRIQMPNYNSSNIHTKDCDQSENLYLRLLKNDGKALCPKLQDLHLSDYLSTWDMKIMLQLDINFRQLLLPNLMECHRHPTEVVKDVGPFIVSLLERQQSSLEVFGFRIASAVYKDTNSSPFSLQFPCLPKLRKLLVNRFRCGYGLYEDGEFIRFDPVDYATQFPALKDLSLFYRSNGPAEDPRRFDGRIDFYNRFFPDDGQVCPTLQRLSVKVPHPKMKSSKSMPAPYLQFSRRLALMFPNVHNHEEVKACRAKQDTDLDESVANETHRVTRSMTKSVRSTGCNQVGN